MNKKKWKHKITSGLTGVILSFIMLAIFGGLAIWFHVSQNDAIIIGRILVIFAAVAFVLALYRAVFFKVLIDKDGFFYQTAPGNGKYYHYYEIRKMWISSGNETNAQQMTYCNFETNEGTISRFFFMGVNLDAVDYLMKRVEAVETADSSKATDDGRDLVISGKVQGGIRIAVAVFILAILLLLAKSLAEQGLPPITYMLPIAMAAVAVVVLVVHNMFYKIQIEKDGFYCRTNPFDGKYYHYSEITDCKLVEERKKFGSVRNRGVRETHYFYYLIFTDATNKTHRILYNKALFEREMNVLVSRIEQAQGR